MSNKCPGLREENARLQKEIDRLKMEIKELEQMLADEHKKQYDWNVKIGRFKE